MKKSRSEVAQTRKRIVEVASEGIRRNGIQATVLADVMAKAGLTHGGFYRHFESKDQLVAEACASGMAVILDAAAAAAESEKEKCTPAPEAITKAIAAAPIASAEPAPISPPSSAGRR